MKDSAAGGSRLRCFKRSSSATISACGQPARRAKAVSKLFSGFGRPGLTGGSFPSSTRIPFFMVACVDETRFGRLQRVLCPDQLEFLVGDFGPGLHRVLPNHPARLDRRAGDLKLPPPPGMSVGRCVPAALPVGTAGRRVRARVPPGRRLREADRRARLGARLQPLASSRVLYPLVVDLPAGFMQQVRARPVVVATIPTASAIMSASGRFRARRLPFPVSTTVVLGVNRRATQLPCGSPPRLPAVASGAGMFFGFYPAHQAAKPDPVVALRGA